MLLPLYTYFLCQKDVRWDLMFSINAIQEMAAMKAFWVLWCFLNVLVFPVQGMGVLWLENLKKRERYIEKYILFLFDHYLILHLCMMKIMYFPLFKTNGWVEFVCSVVCWLFCYENGTCHVEIKSTVRFIFFIGFDLSVCLFS